MLRIKKRPYQFCLSGNTIHYQFFSEEAVYDKTVTFEIKVLFDYNQTGVPSPEVITLPLVPVDGYADIDLKDILHAQLEYGVPLITGTETDCSVAAKQSGVFYVQFRQITSAIADPPWTDSEKDFLVRIIKGGLPVLKFQGTNFWQNYFALTVETKFFTWQLSNRMAAVYERMYLCWFNTSDAVSVKGFLKLVYTDGTDNTQQTVVTAAKYQIGFIPVGAAQWNLPGIAQTAGKSIYYWELTVMDMTDPAAPVQISETFRYYADNRNLYKPVTLHYRNSLGGLDSVRLRGQIDDNVGHSFQEIEKAMPFNYYATTEMKSGRSITNGKEQLTRRGDAGHLYKDEQDRMRDALVNRNGYQYISGKWYPIILTNQNFKLRSTADKRFSFPLEWSLASAPDLYYSPDSVDLGNGGDVAVTENVCECSISNWTWTREFGAGDTICYLHHSFLLSCTGSDATRIQYRVIGFYDWQDYNLSSGPLVTSHPAGTEITIEMRPVCPNGVPGFTDQRTISTVVGGTGGGGGGTNSSITNTGSHSGYMTLYTNSAYLVSGTLNGGGAPLYFNVGDLTGANIVLYLGGAGITFAQLTTNGGANSYSGTINPNVMVQFTGVDIINGIQIVIS